MKNVETIIMAVLFLIVISEMIVFFRKILKAGILKNIVRFLIIVNLIISMYYTYILMF